MKDSHSRAVEAARKVLQTLTDSYVTQTLEAQQFSSCRSRPVLRRSPNPTTQVYENAAFPTGKQQQKSRNCEKRDAEELYQPLSPDITTLAQQNVVNLRHLLDILQEELEPVDVKSAVNKKPVVVVGTPSNSPLFRTRMLR